MKEKYLIWLIFYSLTTTPFLSFSQNNFHRVTGRVYESNTNEPLSNAKIQLVGSNGSKYEIKTNTDGLYHFDSSQIKLNIEYKISCIYTGFPIQTFDYSTINTNESKELKFDFAITFSGCKSLTLISNYINATFELNSYKLTSEFKKELDTISRTLSQNPTLTIEIWGYADEQELTASDTLLPSKRALEVYNYLVIKGVNSKRLFCINTNNTDPFQIGLLDEYGFKAQSILDSNFITSLPSELEKNIARKLNRRVEIYPKSPDFIED